MSDGNNLGPLGLGPRHEEPSRRVESRRAARRQQRRSAQRRRSLIITSLVLLLVVAIGGAALYLALQWIKPGNPDYSGSGSGEVMVKVASGATGTDIGRELYKNEVVASVEAFTEAWTKNQDAVNIQPGTYRLHKKMSADTALAFLLDKSNRVDNQITVGPGTTKWQVKDRMVSAGGFSAEEVEAAMNDAAAIGLPAEAGGNIEGWMAPGSYLVAPGQSATEVLQEMVSANITRLEKSGLAREQWQSFLTEASIVQREGSDLHPDDYAKIATVINNRLDGANETQGFLNMDSTVLYGLGEAVGSRSLPTKTEVENANNPYNTYRHKGLPPSPIGAVGEGAFEGTLHPVEGQKWLYFVTVNLNTGETLFTNTLAEQNANVEKLKAFCNENPGLCQAGS